MQTVAIPSAGRWMIQVRQRPRQVRAMSLIPLAKRISDCFKSNRKVPAYGAALGYLVSNNLLDRLREPVSVFEWSAWNVQTT